MRVTWATVTCDTVYNDLRAPCFPRASRATRPLPLPIPPLLHNMIHNPKPNRLFRSHVIIPLERRLEPRSGILGALRGGGTVFGVYISQCGADTEDFFGVEGDIGGLALGASAGFCGVVVSGDTARG